MEQPKKKPPRWALLNCIVALHLGQFGSQHGCSANSVNAFACTSAVTLAAAFPTIVGVGFTGLSTGGGGAGGAVGIGNPFGVFRALKVIETSVWVARSTLIL